MFRLGNAFAYSSIAFSVVLNQNRKTARGTSLAIHAKEYLSSHQRAANSSGTQREQATEILHRLSINIDSLMRSGGGARKLAVLAFSAARLVIPLR
jgi:hypothetical protein